MAALIAEALMAFLACQQGSIASNVGGVTMRMANGRLLARVNGRDFHVEIVVSR